VHGRPNLRTENCFSLRPCPKQLILDVIAPMNMMRSASTTPLETDGYRPFFVGRDKPDLDGILAKMRTQFEAGTSGEYLARPIEQILSSKRLDGCQDWGLLWVNLLRKFGVEATYIQAVDTKWLDEHAKDWDRNGWRGHVFVEARFSQGTVCFCSTSARSVELSGINHGRDMIDGNFVILFKGADAQSFDACSQEGINRLLAPLVAEWRAR